MIEVEGDLGHMLRDELSICGWSNEDTPEDLYPMLDMSADPVGVMLWREGVPVGLPDSAIRFRVGELLGAVLQYEDDDESRPGVSFGGSMKGRLRATFFVALKPR